MRSLNRYAVSLGHPYGVGPEIIVKALPEAPTAHWMIFGDEKIVAQAMTKWGGKGSARGKIEIVHVESGDDPLVAQEAYIERAADAVRSGTCKALVTAPMLRMPGSPGHTELLAQRTGTPDVAMMMEADWLRVALATGHIPLRDVSRTLTPERIAKVARLLAVYLEAVGHRKGARIALAALNPHNDAGPPASAPAMRESTLLAKAVALARTGGTDLSGPLPADALFGSRDSLGYQGIVALYHDQGLIPAKLIAGHAALNITMGLPFARISPGHGVALDIAGRGIADARGMVAAMSYLPILAARWPW